MSYKRDLDYGEHREKEQIVADECNKYYFMIEDFKTMCDEKHLVRKATGEKTEFEDDMEELYYEPEFDENTMNYYLLDNGLHVYTRENPGEDLLIIQDTDLDMSEIQTSIYVRRNNNLSTISFFLGEEGPELPYQIVYDSQDKMFGYLPINGLLYNETNIRKILEKGLNFYNKSEHEPDWAGEIESFKSLISLYDKFSDIVKTVQHQQSDSKSPLQKKDEELSVLEEEAEALIDKQAEKEGQNIGEE